MKRSPVVWPGWVLFAVAAAGTAYWKLSSAAALQQPKSQASDGPVVPTARVLRGSIALDVNVTGELRAARSVALSAPSVGGTLRILRLLPTGTAVKTGDVLVELDPSDQEFAARAGPVAARRGRTDDRQAQGRPAGAGGRTGSGAA